MTWVMLVDALGHGPKAAEAAALAVEAAEQFTATFSVERALGQLHQRLHGSRGAAAALLRFEGSKVSFAGVGNVELRTLAGPAIPYMATNGVLGARMPRPRVGEVALEEPGRVLLFTDGIARGTPIQSMIALAPELLCERLIADHSLERDDATVLHVSYS
ncbi:Anti-sigma B factor RsbT / Phosphoserine phosphatase RsbX [Enhygromyxa salina]|uniref:Anti-sigma B factor RsbT / Phosphoserine phosphatase RsbX n=1 Tax=Enhygromyxa salina TaxID=215803 RepID=A0A0C1ZI77_9BACT|nr:SpoIIE family protein phosphatase [Enhygromyxa salina]KIG17244.1 Anti-sigma B factor RsbT / Phosphoserine phosphatase RsbX [Enhygromyxa salina]